MHRRLVLPLASVALLSAMVIASDEVRAEEVEAEEQVEKPAERDTQELGAMLGVSMGGRVTPGGLAIGGRYLYRMNDEDWLESSANFSFGSSDPECFRDRDSNYLCRHGLLDGFGAELALGLRRYFAGQAAFRPFARAGLGVAAVSFSNDEVLGIAFPAYVGAGIRASVAPKVQVVADTTFRVGFGAFDEGLGFEPIASLSIGAGVEFTLE